MRERIITRVEAADRGRNAHLKRWLIDLGVLVAIGLLMGFLGPFGSDRAPGGQRYAYWMICMVGGGVIAIVGDQVLGRFVKSTWKRVLLGSVMLTMPVSLLVLYAAYAVMDNRFDWQGFFNLPKQVWPILLAVLAVQALTWRRPETKIEKRIVVAPPLPEAEAAFRKRLSARRRTANLVAVQAYDHYLKVHTDVGEELITLRMADALSELERAHGWQVHRSWWVSADAVSSARWLRTTGELTLNTGMTVPVSRTYRPVLKEAGWL